MSKFIGRIFNVGIGRESSRGTAVVATYWLPWASLTIDDEVKVAKDETTIGVIEDGVGQEVTTFISKGSINGRITDQSFPLILKAALGTEGKTTPATGVYLHAFTVTQSAQHPALTISVVEPNSNSGAGYAYPLGMITDLDMTFELDKYAMYKMGFEANKGATKSNTVSYTAENAFRPQDGTFVTAATISGLGSPTTVNVKKAQITIKKNPIADTVIGNTSPVDRLNQSFQVSGSFELFYSDRTFIDTDMLGDIYQAIRLTFTNSAVTIGSASNPIITITLARVKMDSVSRKIDQKGIVSQTIKFTAFYSLGDTELLDISVQNTVSTTY